jgi:hypothetical protein
MAAGLNRQGCKISQHLLPSLCVIRRPKIAGKALQGHCHYREKFKKHIGFNAIAEMVQTIAFKPQSKAGLTPLGGAVINDNFQRVLHHIAAHAEIRIQHKHLARFGMGGEQIFIDLGGRVAMPIGDMFKRIKD